MEIKIVGWGYENIRRFKSLDIDLQQGEAVPHITLVMMRNGTGKTTTTHLMRATLDGNASKWTPDMVREYMPPQIQVDKGRFYIKIKFGNSLYHYNLILDYKKGKASYQTSRAGLSGGMSEGHQLPKELDGVLTEQFVSRFIFDGEQARKTLSSKSNEAELAVTYLYQLDKLDNIISSIESIVNRKQNESDYKGASPQSLSNNKTRTEAKKKIYLDLVKKRDKFKKEQSELQEKHTDLENQRQQLIAADKDLRDKQKVLLDEKAEKVTELGTVLQHIGVQIKEPFQVNVVFDRRLQELISNMQTLKLPKTTAREFFRELSESKECVCGRHIGPEEKKAILDRADKYLGEDDLGAINAIKDRLRHYNASNELIILVNKMSELRLSIQDIQNALDRLTLQLNEDAKREAEKISKVQNDINDRLIILKHELSILNAPIGAPNTDEQNNIPTAEKVWKEYEENLQRATGTYEYTQKANILEGYIEKIKEATLTKLKTSILKKTNEKVEAILTDEKITIDNIDGNLILHDRNAVSEGQTLAIAYAYIGSLFEHSDFEFPFVIDSPANSMDLGVRREAASVIPDLFKQLIVFITSGEVAGFGQKFYLRNDVNYLTIEDSHDNGKTKCTVGKDYFATYQNGDE